MVGLDRHRQWRCGGRARGSRTTGCLGRVQRTRRVLRWGVAAAHSSGWSPTARSMVSDCMHCGQMPRTHAPLGADDMEWVKWAVRSPWLALVELLERREVPSEPPW